MRQGRLLKLAASPSPTAHLLRGQGGSHACPRDGALQLEHVVRRLHLVELGFSTAGGWVRGKRRAAEAVSLLFTCAMTSSSTLTPIISAGKTACTRTSGEE